MDIKKEIVAWFQGDRDFDAWIVLFGMVTRNSFYLSNLARSRRQRTLEYELGKVLKRAGIEVGRRGTDDRRRKTEVTPSDRQLPDKPDAQKPATSNQQPATSNQQQTYSP